MKNKINISVVIPCYRSEKTITKVVDEVVETLKNRKGKFEIILVNDCSPDDVWNEIIKLSIKYPSVVTGISLSRNFGQHAALMAGYRESKGEIVVSMDDDGQTNPKEIWKLVDRLDDGYDAVFAKYPVNKESLFRRFGSWLNDKMSIWLLGKPDAIKGTSYNAIRRFVIDEMIIYNNPYPYIGGLVFRITKKCGEVEIEHKEREYGKSGYSLGKLISLILNGFTAFSVKPLRIATFVGFTSTIFGFVLGIIIVIRRLTNSIVEIGYASIMASILFIGGILMLILGLIGEYIGRIYICINNSPQYVIKERINKRH